MAVMAGLTDHGRRWSVPLCSPVRPIPVNRVAEADIEGRSGAEAKFPLRQAHVQTPARLAVGLGGIPGDLSGETGHRGDLQCEVADGNLHSASEIDRLGLVVTLGGKYDAFDGVLDIEKLARGRAIAPEDDLLAAL